MSVPSENRPQKLSRFSYVDIEMTSIFNTGKNLKNCIKTFVVD